MEKYLRGVGLWEEVKDRLNAGALSFSGGQQQRMCLARILALEPDMLLLDEPTASLDKKSSEVIEELLKKLKQHGIKMAVVTSKKGYMLERGMQCLGMLPYIDVTVSVLDTERGKPAPDPMLLACKRLGLAPGECLCVGDSPFDIQSGNAAGCVTVAVEYTQLDWQSLLEQGKPSYTIAQPLDLLQLLDKLADSALSHACDKD